MKAAGRALLVALILLASWGAPGAATAATGPTDRQIIRAALRDAWSHESRRTRADLCNAWFRPDLRAGLVRSVGRPIARTPGLERRPVRHLVRRFLTVRC